MIYFVLDDLSFAVKIGLTHIEIGQRMSSLQVGNPRKLKLLGFMEGNRQTEESLHARLEPFRVNGEWFDLKSEDVQHVLLYLLNEIHNLDHKGEFWEAEERTRMFRLIQAAKNRDQGGRLVTVIETVDGLRIPI